jgi:hypothetical protein
MKLAEKNKEKEITIGETGDPPKLSINALKSGRKLSPIK